MFPRVSGTEQLGGFIHNFVWSPDGTKALALAENVTATVQTLEFFSPQRKANSLNWWLYDFKTGKAVLLDEKIVSIGWASNDEAVYNWGNKDLSLASLDNSGLSNNIKLADITSDSNNLDSIIPPVGMNGLVAFPLQKGFYAVALGRKTAKYYSLAGGVQKVLADPLEQKYFIILSSGSLYKFTVPDDNLTVADNIFSAADLAFLGKDSLVTAGTDGRVYSYDLNTKIKTLISMNVSADISRVFSAANSGEFLFVVGKNIYKKSLKDNSTTLLGQDWNTAEKPLSPAPQSSSPQTTQSSGKNPSSESGATLTPAEQQQAAAPANNKSNLVILSIAVLFILLIIGILIFMIKKHFKKTIND